MGTNALGERGETARREPVAIDCERKNKHQRQPEPRQRHAKYANQPRRIIHDRVPQQCSKGAESERQSTGNDEGQCYHLDRYREGPGNLAIHGAAGHERTTEITVQHELVQPGAVLHHDGPIETVVMVELSDLGLGCVRAQHDVCRRVGY